MSSSFWTTIGEIAEVFDGPHATPTKTDSGPFFLSISSLENGHLDLSKSAHLSEEDFIKWTRRITPKEGDVLFSYETRLGDAALMPGELRACLGRRMGLLRPKLEKVIPEYLLYAYLSPKFQEVIRSKTVHGATVDRLALKEIPSFPIFIPSKKEQQHVVSVLKSLNEKIELNRQTNQTLEQIAQALFKSWFVDFEPTRAKIAAKEAGASPEEIERAAMCAISGKTPDQLAQLPPETQQNLKTTAALFPDSLVDSELGEIPAGWEVKTMNDISTVGIGKTPPRKESQWFSTNKQDVRWVSIRDMGIAGTYMTTTTEYLTPEAVKKFNVRIIPANTLMLSFKMTIGRLAISDGEMASNEAIAHFKLNDESSISTEFVYLYLKQFDFSTYSSTSSIADAVNSNTVKNTPILLPRNSILSMFDKKVSSIFQDLKNRERETRQLVELRDALLPKLLSGEIPITESLTDLQGAA